MKLGAIVVVGKESKWSASPLALMEPEQKALVSESLACIEVCGRSVLDRVIARFLGAGVDLVTVLVQADSSCGVPLVRNGSGKVTVQVANDLTFSITQKLTEYLQMGIEHSFVNRADKYVETDLLDLFYFHREGRHACTRAFDREGPLDLWVFDGLKLDSIDIDAVMQESGRCGTSYFVREYVQRFSHPRNLRQFASDILLGHCERGPSGEEARPGVWINKGADVRRSARIVAPAYIGRGSRILEDTLITRCSSIEEGCFVDCGTVIENSSVLANTHVGIWLDVCQAVVKENRILSLDRDVVVEISDPTLLHPTLAVAGSRRVHAAKKQQAAVVDFVGQPLAERWQFGTKFIPD